MSPFSFARTTSGNILSQAPSPPYSLDSTSSPTCSNSCLAVSLLFLASHLERAAQSREMSEMGKHGHSLLWVRITKPEPHAHCVYGVGVLSGSVWGGRALT